MNELKLVFPNESYAEEILSFKKEFLDNQESMNGTSGLRCGNYS